MEVRLKTIRKKPCLPAQSRACLILVLFFGFAVWFPLASRAANAEPLRVLVLQSYHQGFSWTDALQKGITETFAEADVDIELSLEYLDGKRHPAPLLFNHLSSVYAVKYARWRPDLILSCDDDALAFLFEYRNSLFPGVPVVFCGLNVDDYDPAILENRTGYTGVVERLDLGATIDLILLMQPDVAQIAFIHDQTTSGLADRQTIAALAPAYADRVNFVYPDDGLNSGAGVSEAQLMTFLENLSVDSAVYFLGFFRDGLGTPLASDHIIQGISEASPVPVYTHAEAYLGYGVFGGKLLSAEVHGRSTAEKALRLLAGVPLEQVPVSVESSNRYMFDYRQLERFAVSESRLPEGSLILFGPISFWERHRAAIAWAVGALCALIAFTTALLVNSVRRHRIERRLAASEKQYRLLADHATDMISRHDQEGVFLYVSPACRRLLGYESEELIGEDAYTLYHPEDLDRIRNNHRTILEDPAVSIVSYRIRQKQGRYIWVETTSRTIRNPQTNGFKEIVAVTRDITERKQAQEERLQMEKHLQAVQRLESLGVLAGGIAHDFNNILMSMLGNIELVKEDHAEDPRTSYRLDESMQAGERAASLIRQMLMFSGKDHFVAEPIDLNRLIESIFELLQTAVPAPISLELKLDRTLAKIGADESQIRQVLMNLVLNAAESYPETAEGLVIISTGAAEYDRAALAETESEIWLTYQEPFKTGRYVFLQVEDTGAGMALETRRHLFEPFFSTKFLGRGLGLAAVLGIVRSHKGFMRIDSESGRGTVVRVLFPALEDTTGHEKPDLRP